MIRRAVALVAIVAIAQTRFAGRPLVDVLREMQQRGLNVVYSSDLVKPDMRVMAEPRATGDRAVLDEILPPLGLAAKNGPGGVVLIVRGVSSRVAVQAPPPALTNEPKPLMPVELAHIVVTASDYPVLGSAPEQRQFLTRDEVNRTPHLADDVFHALSRLPGATANDLSAAFGVRGGTPEDVLVLLDGVEIAQPFHFRYFQNIISVFDSEAIGSLDYLSGGAPVEYGDRMSGVIDMSTTSDSAARTYAGVSFTHARLLSSGAFDGDRGQWLLSARRGYFDLLLDLFYPDVRARPRYGDFVGKLQYRIGDSSVLSANALAAVDRFNYQFTGSGDFVRARYGNRYGWLNLRSSWTPRLSSQIVASFSHLTQDKRGGFDFTGQAADVVDRRTFSIAGFKQDWTLDRGDRGHFVKWGLDVKHYGASYDYTSSATLRDSVLLFAGNPRQRDRAISIAPHGESLGGYVADRVRVAKIFTIEAGLRYESESWMRGDAAVTPRVNVVVAPNAQTAIRASWGEYRQAQRPDEIAVEDGDAVIHPAQVSRDAELGIEHRFPFGIESRLALYRRDIAHPRPRFENLFDRDEFFPEVRYDRIRLDPDAAAARGVELLVKDDRAGPLSWWISFAHSRVVDRFGATEVPRSWDQPEAASFSVNYKRSAAWNFNVSGLIRTGWPSTAITANFVPGSRSIIEAELGERNALRFPMYQRFDVRAMRRFVLSHGTFSSWIDVSNAFNRPNDCCGESIQFNANPFNGSVKVIRKQSAVGWLPSFGVAWEF